MLIEGESGTGKELFARAVRAEPARRRPRGVNCAAIPETLLSRDQLFDRYEKGAFTGCVAAQARQVRIPPIAARCSSMKLATPLTLRPRFCVPRRETLSKRVGGTTLLHVDVRVVAATNRNLAAVAARQYREDLYFRLSVFPITVPPP